MSDTAYCRIHGLDITGIVEDTGISVSGDERKTDSYSVAGMDYATILQNGREGKTYSVDVSGSVRTDIERFRRECNNAPRGAEFCPFTADQVAYVEAASATPAAHTFSVLGWFYKSQGTIVCRDGFLYGLNTNEETDYPYVENPDLPYTIEVTNAGGYPSGIDYLYLSGTYLDGKYSRDLNLAFGGRTLRLCDQLLRDDDWVMDRWGNIRHFWESKFTKTEADTQTDLGGEAFFSLGTGGSIAYEDLVLGADGLIMVPFYGPHAITRAPFIEVNVLSMAGNPTLNYALSADLSDIAEVELSSLQVGYNKLYLPNDVIAEDFVALGIVCDENGFIEMSNFRAQVERHVSLSQLPYIEIDETDDMILSDGESSNHTLRSMQMLYRDIF